MDAEGSNLNAGPDPALDERPAPDLLAAIRHNKLTILAVVLASGVVCAAVRVAFPGARTATVHVTLQTTGSRLTESGPLTPAAQQTFVANQAAFFTDREVLARLAADLNGRFSPRTLAGKIHARPTSVGTIVAIEVSDARQASAVAIANTLVSAYRQVVRQRTEVEAANAAGAIAASEADLSQRLTDTYAAGAAGRATAPAIATALAALAVQAVQVRVNSKIYDDGVMSWQAAAGTRGGVRTPDLRLTAGGAAIGLLLGVLLAWIRSDRAREIGTADEATRLLGVPLLEELAETPTGLPSPLSGQVDPDPYLRLFSVVAADDRATVVAITPVCESAGATTTAVGLAMTAARAGARVLLVDADPSSGRLAAELLVEPGGPGLYEVAAGDVSLSDALVSCTVGDSRHVDVLSPGASAADYPHVVRARGRMVLSELSAKYDHVFVDTGPVSTNAGAVAILPLAEAVITVLRRGTPSDAASAARAQLTLLKVRDLGYVFTFSRAGKSVHG